MTSHSSFAPRLHTPSHHRVTLFSFLFSESNQLLECFWLILLEEQFELSLGDLCTAFVFEADQFVNFRSVYVHLELFLTALDAESMFALAELKGEVIRDFSRG